MTTIRPLGENRWQVRTYLGVDPSGKPMRPSKTITAPNKRAAQDRAREWERQLRASGRTDHRPRTVADAVDAWLATAELKAREDRTLASYRRLGGDIKAGLGARHVEDLSVSEVQTWYRKLVAGRTRGGRRLSHHHAALRAVLNEAMRHGWVDRNVARLTSRPTEKPVRVAPPTVEAVHLLREAALERSPVVARLLAAAVGTGMRRGELAAMRASRFDVAAWTYMVDTAVAGGDRAEVIVKPPKTHATRAVPLPEFVVAAVLEQAAYLEARAQLVGVELVADPWLWSPAPDCSQPPHPDWLSREFRAVRRAAGVEGRLHDLRHAYATMALDMGIPLPTVSEILGHANPATTAAIYSHGVTVSARRAAELMNRAYTVAELEAGDAG